MFFTREGEKNTECRVDLGSVEMRNDHGANWPMKRCKFTKVELTKERVDHELSWNNCNGHFLFTADSTVTGEMMRI